MTRRRKLIAAVAVPFALTAGAGALSYDYLRAAAFIVQAAEIQGVPRTLAAPMTDAVSSRDARIPWRDGELRGRIYVTPDAEGVPLLLVPGVHATGIDEPRLIELARDLSSMGRRVVTMELPDLKAYAVTSRSTDMIEDAAKWLSEQRDLTTDGRVGLMGISFAGGLAVVAAGRPSIRDRVALVLSFGGHGDLPRTLRYLCTGVQPDGVTRAPHDYGIAIILLGVADRMTPPEQVAPLQTAIRAFLHASHVDIADKTAGREAFEEARRLAAALPEPARTLMGYVNDRDVSRLGPLLLPHVGALGGEPALSPARSPAPHAPVYLLHGSDDTVIPAVESALLAEHLRGAGVPVRQLATPLITHAEVDRSSAARAFWDLVRFWSPVLSS